MHEEEKEKGYGWGMDIRASPRKGYTKNREEIYSLKTKKCLLVVKPVQQQSGQESEECSTTSGYEPKDNTMSQVHENDKNGGVMVQRPIINVDEQVQEEVHVEKPLIISPLHNIKVTLVDSLRFAVATDQGGTENVDIVCPTFHFRRR